MRVKSARVVYLPFRQNKQRKGITDRHELNTHAGSHAASPLMTDGVLLGITHEVPLFKLAMAGLAKAECGEALQMESALLYVAVSRAREQLVITTQGNLLSCLRLRGAGPGNDPWAPMYTAGFRRRFLGPRYCVDCLNHGP